VQFDERDLRGGDFGDEFLQSAMLLGPLTSLLNEIHGDIDGSGFLAFGLVGESPGRMSFAGCAMAVGVTAAVRDADQGGGDEGADLMEVVESGLGAFSEVVSISVVHGRTPFTRARLKQTVLL